MKNSTRPYRVKNNITKCIISNTAICNNIENGYIKLTIMDAVTNKPIENAKIDIFELRVSGLYHESGTGDIISTQTSDSNGQVPIIELQANYEPEEILEVGHEHIFYQMIITAEGYCIVFVASIIIYPNITNEYLIKMSPRSLDRPLYEFIITPVIP